MRYKIITIINSQNICNIKCSISIYSVCGDNEFLRISIKSRTLDLMTNQLFELSHFFVSCIFFSIVRIAKLQNNSHIKLYWNASNAYNEISLKLNNNKYMNIFLFTIFLLFLFIFIILLYFEKSLLIIFIKYLYKKDWVHSYYPWNTFLSSRTILFTT